MYRFIKAATNLVLNSSNVQVATLLGEASRSLHSSLLRLQDQSFKGAEQFGLEARNLAPSRVYHDNITLVGDVAREPYPLYRDGELYGYKLKIKTLRRLHDRSDGSSKEIPNYHEAICHNKACFSLIKDKLKVNSQVVVHGSLRNAVTRNLEDVTYRTIVRVDDLTAIADN